MRFIIQRAYEIGGLSGKCYPFSRLLDDHGGIPSEVPKTRYDDVALVVFSYDLNDKGYLRKFTYGSILRRLQSTRWVEKELAYKKTLFM